MTDKRNERPALIVAGRSVFSIICITRLNSTPSIIFAIILPNRYNDKNTKRLNGRKEEINESFLDTQR